MTLWTKAICCFADLFDWNVPNEGNLRYRTVTHDTTNEMWTSTLREEPNHVMLPRASRSKAAAIVLRRWLDGSPAQFIVDGLCGAAAVLLAYLMRFERHFPAWAPRQMVMWAVILFVADPVVISIFQRNRAPWQHFGLRDIRRLVQRLGLLNLVLMAISGAVRGQHLMPVSIVVIDFLLVVFFSCSARVLLRMDYEATHRIGTDESVLIIGTEQTVAAAVRLLQPLYGRGVRGVLVESGMLRHRSIHGVPVVGSTDDLARSIRQHGTTLVFLCSADLKDLATMIETASQFDVHVKFLPSVRDLMNNAVRVSKPVKAEALQLGKPAATNSQVILDMLHDKIVLITGAGGSIGSELARHVSRCEIRKLILLDQDENALFELMQELGQRGALQPVVADIRDEIALRELFSHELPQVVLHAAAYKHVPMMEANPCEAVLNNVSGTRLLAETALAYRAERLVMISSDKAVRPSSVMGASKRAAEVVIQEIARQAACDEDSCTQFACVRFGNVLGSRGSVLPIFLKQIEAGGPLTVTHEEMSRYFMTIPQAVHLVLQAASLGSHGDIYMLDMGDPVRIMRFAREVIQLAGLTPGKDIEINITGSRPGEKLHEELWREGAKVSPTELQYIFRVHAESAPPDFEAMLAELEHAARDHRHDRIRDLLLAMPLQYRQGQEIEPAVRPDEAVTGVPA